MRPWVLVKSALSIIISAAIVCTSSVVPYKLSAQEIVVEYQHYDLSELEIAISHMEDALRQDNNNDGVTQCYNEILIQKDKMETQQELAYINYAADMSQNNTDEYNYMCQTITDGMDMIYTGLNNALNTKYKTLMKDLLGDFYTAIDEYDITGEEQIQIVTAKQEIEQEYQNIVMSSKSTSQKNLECAELYLKLVKMLNKIIEPYDCNYLEYTYYLYNRDYSLDDISVLYPAVKKDISDSYNRVIKNMQSLPEYSRYTGEIPPFENNFEQIKLYSSQISDELYQSAQFITDNNLYKFGNGENSIEMAFTTVLPQYRTAFIYQYLNDDKSDILSSIHEFGHFNTMRNCDTSSDIDGASINLDISEVQSQGLEILYTKFFNKIFDEYGELFRQNQYANMLESIADGFMVNEFEDYVFNNAENMTAADVVDKYESLSKEYGVTSIQFYRIHHLFGSPGYYISYATSALAVVELCDVMNSSFDDAVDMYTVFSHIDPTDEDNQYKECLIKSGFGDVLSSEYIDHIASVTDNVLDRLVYGDIDKNGVVTARDVVMMKLYILNTLPSVVNDENKQYDLNKDKTINAADLCKLISILVTQ